MAQTVVVRQKSSQDELSPTQKQNHKHNDIFRRIPAAITSLTYEAHVGRIGIQSQGCHVHKYCDGTPQPIRKLIIFTLGHTPASCEFMYVLELALNARLVLKAVCIGPGGPSLINQMDAI